MQELMACIECAAKGLVDNPDAVNVSVSEEGSDSVIYLSVAEDDLGKVIGKSGRTIDALRAILGAAASRQHIHCRLEIVENG
jgi:hypothetical protein